MDFGLLVEDGVADVYGGNAFFLRYNGLSTPCRGRVCDGDDAEGPNLCSNYFSSALAFRASCEVDRIGEAALLPRLLVLRTLLLRLLILESLLRIDAEPLRSFYAGACGGGPRLFAAKAGRRNLFAEEFRGTCDSAGGGGGLFRFYTYCNFLFTLFSSILSRSFSLLASSLLSSFTYVYSSSSELSLLSRFSLVFFLSTLLLLLLFLLRMLSFLLSFLPALRSFVKVLFNEGPLECDDDEEEEDEFLGWTN